MRTTVTIDDDLYEAALRIVGPTIDEADLFREAPKTFIEVQGGQAIGRFRRDSAWYAQDPASI